MPLNRCVLSGKEIDSLGRFFDEISRQLKFPGHFGRNLDALWDVLTADVPGPVEIIWRDAEDSEKKMGEDFLRVMEILRDAENEREDLKITLG